METALLDALKASPIVAGICGLVYCAAKYGVSFVVKLIESHNQQAIERERAMRIEYTERAQNAAVEYNERAKAASAECAARETRMAKRIDDLETSYRTETARLMQIAAEALKDNAKAFRTMAEGGSGPHKQLPEITR
jgi:hypothetical protein